MSEQSKKKTFRSAREVFKTYLPNKMKQPISDKITDIVNKPFDIVCHTDDGIRATDILDVLKEARKSLESAEAEIDNIMTSLAKWYCDTAGEAAVFSILPLDTLEKIRTKALEIEQALKGE